MTIIHNAYTENLARDEFVAVNAAGIPVGRAGSRAALERAHAGADVRILSAAEVAQAEPTLAEASTAGLEGPFAAVVAQGIAENAFAAPGKPTGAEDTPKVDGSAFDHDGNGKVGGSAPKAKKVKASK